MSFSKVYSAQASLTRATILSIEVDLSRGLNSFTIVGLPDKAVEESKDRVSAAIKNSGYASPKSKNQKVVISLAPADIKKEGPIFDVPMALAYLLAADDIRFDPEKKLFLGELSLDGELRSITGVLPLAREAKRKGFEEIYVPKGNAKEAALIEGLQVFGVEKLEELLDHINTKKSDVSGSESRRIQVQPLTKIEKQEGSYEIDFADIHGQEGAKRALLIAAAGGHNIAMIGPPGTGKTMLAKAFRHTLPDLIFDDMLEVMSIHSVAGLLADSLITDPPFRAPHHTASYISIVGGGTVPKPGEITLAHRGVLFLDEFPEFDRKVIDSLRQPLEEGTVTIARAKGTMTFPANVILIVALNPCPCGYLGSTNHECICTPNIIARYQRKISGPIIDRIDLWTTVSTIKPELFTEKIFSGEKTEQIKKKIDDVRQVQQKRFSNHPRKISLNSHMSSKDISEYLTLDKETKLILNSYSERLGLSGRAHHRIMKVARTIADLDAKENIDSASILEAIQYRPKKTN